MTHPTPSATHPTSRPWPSLSAPIVSGRETQNPQTLPTSPPVRRLCTSSRRHVSIPFNTLKSMAVRPEPPTPCPFPLASEFTLSAAKGLLASSPSRLFASSPLRLFASSTPRLFDFSPPRLLASRLPASPPLASPPPRLSPLASRLPASSPLRLFAFSPLRLSPVSLRETPPISA